MDSNSCHSSVINVIYNLRKKIELDSQNPTYLKTVSGIGYKFSADGMGEVICHPPLAYVFILLYYFTTHEHYRMASFMLFTYSYT